MSGLRGYGSEMIYRWGRWYIPRWIDREPGGVGRAGRGQGNVSGTGVVLAGEEMLFTSPSMSPSFSPSGSFSLSASASPSESPSASPSPSAWAEKTSNTYWGGTNCTWDGTKWNITGPGMILHTTFVTWNHGYRPTKIRVTGIAASSGTVRLIDDGSVTIASWSAATGPVTADITWASDDIWRLSCGTEYNSVSLIEFEE